MYAVVLHTTWMSTLSTHSHTHTHTYIQRHKNINRLNKFSLSINPECTNLVYANNSTHSHSHRHPHPHTHSTLCKHTYTADSSIHTCTHIYIYKNRTEMISIMPILTLVIITSHCVFVGALLSRDCYKLPPALAPAIHSMSCQCVSECNIWISSSFSSEQWDFHKLIDCRNFPERVRVTK